MIEVLKYSNLVDTIQLLQRPYLDHTRLKTQVLEILNCVRDNGDSAIYDFIFQFERIRMDNFKVSEMECNHAANDVSDDLKAAINVAYENIKKFHLAQQQDTMQVETMPGVICMRKSVAIERVGLYIPGGSAALFSTLLMLSVPAILAGCKEIVICTPATSNGKLNPNVAYIAQLLGIKEIYKIGGAHAIAALAFGTTSIPKVNKIFGPGNQFVTIAKQLVQEYGVAIDMPAGPSEVLVIADANANPKFIAADLLSQAEHGPDSQVVLLSNDVFIFDKVIKEINAQLTSLSRSEISKSALQYAKFVLTKTIDEAICLSNAYAPEHLILNFEAADLHIDKIVNAGSVFIGAYSPESVGDYASGTNHTLPTNAYAKAYSGVSIDSFVKKITFQKLNYLGLKNIGDTVIKMAMAEGLDAHANAVKVRLDSLEV